MSSKTWKKIEKSDAFRKTKLKIRQSLGKEPHLKKDVDINTAHYLGWDIASDVIHQQDIVYSLGISDDIGFEKAIIEKFDVTVFAFDPTPYSVNWIGEQTLPRNFNFYPWAAAGTDGEYFLYPRINKKGEKSNTMFTFHQQEELRSDGVKVEAFSINSMVDKLNTQKIDILKMDIEGAEYDVIDNMLGSALRPKMLLIEFHHRFKGIGKQKTYNSIEKLRQNDYLIASISVTGREFCFVNKSAL